MGVERRALLEAHGYPAASPPGGPGQPGAQGAAAAAASGLSATALDTLTADGLPVLGWHPGFEPGRVLVANATALWGSAGAGAGTPAASASAPGPQGTGGQASSGQAQQQQQQQQPGVVFSGSVGPASPPGVQTAGVGTSSTLQGPASSSGWGKLSGSAVDGYMLTPLLAKAAAEMLQGAAAVDAGVSVQLLDVSRPALGARLQETGDTWDNLSRWQDGTAFMQALKANMTDDELQALDEAEVLARKAKLGAPQRAGSGALPGRGKKLF
uniref:Uncharacterized protein n=1 Tax=Chlamydomonas leiostraca TaxID=1034604 RepID=A0A7S0WZL1_9CHLO